MTSISNYSMAMPPSPRAMMDNKISAAVEAGSLSEVDGDALETALDSIDSALSSSASSSSSSSRLDPSEMKDRVDSLIEDQVSSGALTEDQAAALQSFFAQGGPGGGTESASSDEGMSIDGMQAMGGPQGMRGPPPPPPPSSTDDADEDSSSTSTTSSTDATSAADQLESIIAFLENLRSSLSQSLYGGTTSSSDSSNSGLVVDSLA